MKLTQTTGPNLRGQKPKKRKDLTFKPLKRDLKYNILKMIIMKMLINTAQMKEQTRNIEVQINEEEIGKLPEKEFRIMIVNMTKNLENGENARIN